jgi:hypothetical protein
MRLYNQCDHAVSLRQVMRQCWLLPPEEHLGVHYSGPDCLVLVIGGVEKEVGAESLLILWQAWSVRSDVM